ncbi:hypothetical protein KPHES18087_11810 [Corynebacterium ulcerans]|uniref:Transposase n=1 Tax=Corynebacterium ulcerans TaxID=65058 RepID=A0ABD7MT27_CORUL|nr:Uncharacterised protein [Corynebacterium ulcerans]SQG51320.1 Uncharacterised protein [Corynebacterium ulcerans]SQH02346.1 Uncharacterised protein [Corynebacterium ulcerans]
MQGRFCFADKRGKHQAITPWVYVITITLFGVGESLILCM